MEDEKIQKASPSWGHLPGLLETLCSETDVQQLGNQITTGRNAPAGEKAIGGDIEANKNI